VDVLTYRSSSRQQQMVLPRNAGEGYLSENNIYFKRDLKKNSEISVGKFF
jgi:hypothetical protein